MNDWLVANLNNPDFTVSDFKDIADMSIDNTQFLKKDKYLQSDFIKNNPAFQDDNGQFKQEKFDKYYDEQLQKFDNFKHDKTPAGLELDVFDTLRTPNDRVRNDGFKLGRGYNPDRQKIGIEGINVWSAPEKSRSEIAQSQKVFNTETGKFEDYSPNDKALFNGKTDFGLSWIKSLFSDPLVLAQYDEDTVDKDGTKHKKGDYKLNADGTYYYETLGGRSPIGKQVLSSLDTLTVDGTKLNKYDFFDSDDVEKSIAGVIAKNVATLIPMFLGGPVSTVYSTALIAREMAKSLPMLYGMATALFSDSDTPKWMNTIAAMGDKFTSGTSDYAKEHTFSVENFGNLIADVALQWGQQKTIASAMNKLKGSKNYMEEAVENAEKLYKAKAASMPAQAISQSGNWQESVLGQACLKKYLPAAEKAMKESTQLGRDASLAYMAVVSNSDVYGDALEHGASKKEAAAIAFGSTLGMFAVDKYLGLGELFFDDATEDSVKAARQALKKELFGYEEKNGVKHMGIREAFAQIDATNDTAANKLVQKIHTAADTVKSWMGNYADDLKYHTLSGLGKALGEGLEEVSEELVTDTAKSFYELAGYLGFKTSTKDVGAWDNAFERYSMSFLGGALGGGIFYAKEAFNGEQYKRDKNNDEIATLIRNGHIGELRNEVEKLKKKGKLGSKRLSASQYETTSDGKKVWLTTNDKADSQNSKIADIINEKITAIDAVINNNQVGLDDDALFRNMVMGEQRYLQYLDVAPLTNYYEDFNNVLSNLLAAEMDLKVASNTTDGSTTVTDSNVATDERLRHLPPDQQQKRQEAIDKLKLKVEEARKAKDEFLSGDTSLDYMRKLNFALDANLHAPFMEIDEEAEFKKKYSNKTLEELSDEEKLDWILNIRPNLYKYQTKEQVTKSWDRYKQLEQVINPELHHLTDNAPQFKAWHESFMKIADKLDAKPLYDSYINYDTKLDTESDDEYNHRNEKWINPATGVEETDEEFVQRKNKRIRSVNQINEQKQNDWANSIMQELAKVNYEVDPIIAQRLKQIIPNRVKDILTYKIQSSTLSDQIKSVLMNINPQLDNVQEVLDSISQSEQTRYLTQVKKVINSIPSEFTTYKGPTELLSGLFNPYETTVQDLLDNPNQLWELDDADKDTIRTSLNAITNPELQETKQKVLDNLDTDNQDIVFKELNNLWKQDNSLKGVIEPLLRLYDLKMTKKEADSFIVKLQEIAPFIDTDQDMATEFFDNLDFLESDIEDSVKNVVDAQLQSLNNEVQSIVADTASSPIVKLNQSIKTTIKNPVVELVKSLAGKVLDKTQMPEVVKVLETLSDNFDNVESISDIALDPQQMTTLQNTKDALQLINTYLYAASSSPTNNNIIGHNKVLNQYAKKHSDRVQKWQELPEIDDDYAAIYQQQLSLFNSTLDAWIQLSNNNDINKRKQFEDTDKALFKSFNEFWQVNKAAFTIDVKDKHYNLLEGVVDDNNPQVSTFNYEKIVFANLYKALKESGLSVKDFLQETGVLDKIINFSELQAQQTIRLTPKTKYGDMSSYDKLVYFATVMSLNPVDFYNYLKSSVSSNKDKAPLASQEYAGRITIAQTTQTFRDIMDYAFSKSGSIYYNASNTVIITGDAGSGKTSATCKSVVDFKGPESKVWCVGPTETQAEGLVKSIGRGNSLDIEALMKQILGEQTWQEIKQDLGIKLNEDTEKLESDPKYFDAWADNFVHTKIKKDAIKFNPIKDAPELLIIDEATHIPAPVAQILNEFQAAHGGSLILVGDPKQNSYSSPANAIGNMREVDFFAVRTPELSVSLRDNNIQKQANLFAVKSLLDTVLNNLKTMSVADLNAWWKIAITLLPKLNFRAYNEESLAGDLITKTITPEIVSKLKDAKSLGFIGDTSSASYQALTQAGLKPTVLTKAQMQGQEFDYVIIDQDFKKPDADIDIKNFLQDLYTLMSRGRTASIFIDNGLSSIIGKNQMDTYTAKAPSLTDKINGKSAVDDLKEKKLATLEQFNLSPIEGVESKKTSTEEEKKPDAVSPTDFTNPDDLKVDDDIKDFVDKLDGSSSEEEHQAEDAISSEFNIMSFGDVTLIGATEKNHQKTIDGKTYRAKQWHFGADSNGELRNISAITDDTEAFWYKDKQRLTKDLYAVKSFLIFNHGWDERIPGTMNSVVPSCISTHFNKSDWEQGTYKVEIRSTDGEIQPLFKPMPGIGNEYEGKKYIVNIVFEVKNKKGKICKFDLGGVNFPATLAKNKDLIKTHIQNKLKDTSISQEKRDKLTNILNTIDDRVTKYENLFKSWINEYNKNGKFSLDVSEAITREKRVWMTKRKGAPIRVSGRVDPNSLGTDVNNLIDRNPGFIFSDIYTYANKDPELLKIDPSIKGKAVIFYSSDTLLKQDQLASLYIQQKKHPDTNQPVVRMLKLDNYGMTFSQLNDEEFISKVSGGAEECLPFRANYHGLQMFVSLWNWNVALHEFNKAYNTWASENGYSKDKVNKILQAQDRLYRDPSGKEGYLNSVGVTQEDLDNLDKFNQVVCKNIPTFRLGYGETKKGFHVQRFDVKGSSAYKGKDKANLIVITPEKAVQFSKLSERLVAGICPNTQYLETLGLQLMHPGKVNAKGEQEPPTPWGEDEYIDLKDANHQRTLSGLLTTDLQIVSKDEHGNTISNLVYKDGDQWSSIPNLINNIVRTITYYQYEAGALKGSGQETATISWTDPTTKETKRIHLQIGDIIEDGILMTAANTTNPEGEHPDRSLADMMDLMFHGTTDDIHKKYSSSDPLIQADDARFPKGFFIHADLSRAKESATSDDIISIKDGKNVVFYPIKTSGELFTSDNDLRAAGIDLVLDKLLGITPASKPTSSPVPTTPTTSPSPGTAPTGSSEPSPTTGSSKPTPPATSGTPTEHPNVTALLNDMGRSKYKDDIEQAVTDKNARIQNTLVDLVKADPDAALQSKVNWIYINDNEVTYQTLQDIISNQVKGNFELKINTLGGKSDIIVSAEGKEYILNTETWKLEDTAPPVAKTRLDEEVEYDGKKQSFFKAIMSNLSKLEKTSEYPDEVRELQTTLQNLYANKDSKTPDDIIADLQAIKDSDAFLWVSMDLDESLTQMFEC